MRLPIQKGKATPGFTLVEMAIVLVIIGIILAGVMKGRDIVRGAQVKQFSQQFAQKWGTMASTYYDKTGQFLCDGQVNGGVNAQDPDGIMDGNLQNAAISQRTYDALIAAGINPCTLIKSKLTDTVTHDYTAVCDGTGAAGNTDRVNVFQTTVDGEYAALSLISVDLRGYNLTMGGQAYTRNVVVLYNVPVDVAMGLDTAIDGVANGKLGSCIGLAGAYVQGGYTIATHMNNGATPTSITARRWSYDDSDALVAPGTKACQTVGIVLDY